MIAMLGADGGGSLMLGPEAGGAVMATGIVSIAAALDRQLVLSRVLLVLAAAAWAVLAAVFVGRLVFARVRWREQAGRPAALTAIAGTAVIGTRLVLLGWTWAGGALLAISALLCPVLFSLLARGGGIGDAGDRFLLAVAPQSVAVLAASLAQQAADRWLAAVALALWLVGLGFYGVAFAGFDFRQLRTGAGDHWVAGGALAISTLAAAQIAQALAKMHAWSGVHAVLEPAAVVLWALTVAWLPVLIAAEVRWPRLRYDMRRWATVFPVGMYSVMSIATGRAAGIELFATLGRAFSWVALAAWALTTIGLVAALISHARPSPG